MSALPPKADINRRVRDVRLVPKPYSCAAANDAHGLAYSIIHRRARAVWHFKAERLCGLDEDFALAHDAPPSSLEHTLSLSGAAVGSDFAK
jgi:hypothetical protein